MLSYSLKNLVLICMLSLSSFSFAAQPARPIAALGADDPLQAEFAQIDALPYEDILSMPLEMPLDEAQENFVNSKTAFKNNNHSFSQQLKNLSKKRTRSIHKFYKIKNALASCNNEAHKNKLNTILDQIFIEINALLAPEQSYLNSLDGNHNWIKAYWFMAHKNSNTHYYASILLAERNALQQEKQALIAHIKNLQAFNDGPQRESVPNAPGGVRPQLPRRKSN